MQSSWFRPLEFALVAVVSMNVACGGGSTTQTPGTPTPIPPSPSPGFHYEVLHVFTGGADGAQPLASLIRDSADNLFGTAQVGGTSNYGVVFKLDKTNHETVLHNFTGGGDGRYPASTLIEDASGNLYGTTSGGGRACVHSGLGCGVVFKIAPNASETVLHSFTGGADGWAPGNNLILDSRGNLYGITASGGIPGGCGGGGCGLVFKLDNVGNETALYRFTGGADGGQPTSLIRDALGNFYGVAGFGGQCLSGCGVVFKLDPLGKETTLYSFTGSTDGGAPVGAMVRNSAGNLYGTTEYRGTFDWGVAFRLAPNGTETVLQNFTGGMDGATPRGDLIADTAGNIYGTTLQGGSGCGLFTCGLVFKIDSAGNYTVLHSFNGTDGEEVYGGVILDLQGNLYGTTSGGGVFGGTCPVPVFGCGIIFKLTSHTVSILR